MKKTVFVLYERSIREVDPFMEEQSLDQESYISELADKFYEMCKSFSYANSTPVGFASYYIRIISKIENNRYNKWWIDTKNFIELHSVEVDENANFVKIMNKIRTGEIYNAAIDVWTT